MTLRPPKLPTRLPKPQSTDAAEREYYRHLLIYQRAYVGEMKAEMAHLVPELQAVALSDLPKQMRADSRGELLKSVQRMDMNIEKAFKGLFERVSRKLTHQFPDALLSRWVYSMVNHVNDVSKKNLIKVTKPADLEIEPMLRSGKLGPYFQNVVDANIGLIRSIALDKMSSLKAALVQGITQGVHNSSLSKILSKHFEMSQGKARLIARDQTSKLNGKINEYHQTSIGGYRYIWRTAHDARVRADHRHLDGKTFWWEDPPIIDHVSGQRGNPGEGIQCRCYAEMVLKDVVEL